MSTGEQHRHKPAPPCTPPVGRMRGPDGAERDVYEDPDGRQYVLGEQGEKMYGLWLLATSARPAAPPVKDGSAAGDGKRSVPEPDGDDSSEELPWERRGSVRRDRESHRGRMLGLLGTLSFGMGVMGVCCPGLGVPSLGLALYVRMAARRDLDKMDEGAMDPHGAPRTVAALQDANIGLALSGVGVFLWSIAVVVALFLIM
jgi:hypothetical protein